MIGPAAGAFNPGRGERGESRGARPANGRDSGRPASGFGLSSPTVTSEVYEK
jgi:hypothetical protein